MKPREIKPGIYWVGAIDWDRRLFFSLIPPPHRTRYKSYFIKGSEEKKLIDTVESTIPDGLIKHPSELRGKRKD